MKSTKYLLVGGGVACARAAEAIRSIDRRGDITLVTDEPHLPYDRPPLSKDFITRRIRVRNIRSRPAFFYLKHHVHVLRSAKVLRLDISGGQRYATISYVRRHSRRTFHISFERCLIATGGTPRKIPVPGTELGGVFVLRTVDDAIQIRQAARNALASSRRPPGGTAARVVVIGAGFIGLELAASLRSLGLQVTVVEQANQVWPRIADRHVAQFIQSAEEQHGVEFILGEGVAEIRALAGKSTTKESPPLAAPAGERAGSVITSTGRTIDCEMVCMAVGIEPNIDLAVTAGLLTVEDTGGGTLHSSGIAVDGSMQTQMADGSPAPGIYAAGDIASFTDPYFERRRRVEHYGQAEYTGLIAGTNMAGGAQAYDLLTYVWSDLFELHVEAAGNPPLGDSTILRGNPADGSFTALYLKDKRLIGFIAINGPESDFGPLRMLIQRKSNLSAHVTELADPHVDLRSISTQVR